MTPAKSTIYGWILGVLAVLLAALLSAYLWYPRDEAADIIKSLPPEQTVHETTVHLYYLDPAGSVLAAEQRAADLPEGNSLERVEFVIHQLLTGPTSSDLVSPFPAGLTLDAAFIDNGVVYLDFPEEAISQIPPGTAAESAFLGSLYHTLQDSGAGVAGFQVLVGGRNRSTLGAFNGAGGHISIEKPFLF